MVAQIENSKLRKAFAEEIQDARKAFDEIGGVFCPRYVIHAVK